MKTIADFLAFLAQGNQPVVTFAQGVYELESYAEAGMRARVLNAVRTPDDVVKVTFDFEEFAAHNLPFEKSNYYDKDSVPCLTARQAGFYEPQEQLYFMADDDVDKFMTLEEGSALVLYTEFSASPQGGSYVQWLERQLLASRGATPETAMHALQAEAQARGEYR